MLKNIPDIMQEIDVEDIKKNLIDETREALLAEKKSIEEDTETNKFEKTLKKLRINIKGRVLFGASRENAEQEPDQKQESVQDTEKQATTKSEAQEASPEQVDIFYTGLLEKLNAPKTA